MSTTSARRYTPDDLLTMPEGGRFELVDGELVEHEMSGLSGLVAGTVGRLVGNHVAAAGLGYVLAADSSYQCFPFDPGRVRRPDARSFGPTGFRSRNWRPAMSPSPRTSRSKSFRRTTSLMN